MARYRDFLPQPGVLPRLSPAEVSRFVELGEVGRNRFKAGDADGAEAAYRAQSDLFGANPEPHVSLALVAARRGDAKAAIDHLTEAVVRGFTDLPSVERAEVWGRLAKSMEFLALQDVVPVLEEIERKWGGWSDFRASEPPGELSVLLRNHALTGVIVDGMSPALGPRLTRLWERAIDRSTAAALEAYVAASPDAPDAVDALRRLMAIYAGGPRLRWERVPAEVAGRLSKVGDFALGRSTESSIRSGALVCRALAAYSRRDPAGRQTDASREAIRSDLEAVLASSPEPAFTAVAIEGLVRSDFEAGAIDRASARYRSFRAEHADDSDLVAQVRDELGVLALLVGGLPEIRATALDGTRLDAETLKGKVVVVDFWATWCRPCIEEFDTLKRIAERHGSEVVMVGVNLDRGDDLAESDLEAWVAARGLPGIQIRDGLGWDSKLVKEFGVREIPFTVVAGPDGTVLAVSEGGKALERTVSKGVEAAAVR